MAGGWLQAQVGLPVVQLPPRPRGPLVLGRAMSLVTGCVRWES